MEQAVFECSHDAVTKAMKIGSLLTAWAEINYPTDKLAVGDIVFRRGVDWPTREWDRVTEVGIITHIEEVYSSRSLPGTGTGRSSYDNRWVTIVHPPYSSLWWSTPITQSSCNAERLLKL